MAVIRQAWRRLTAVSAVTIIVVLSAVPAEAQRRDAQFYFSIIKEQMKHGGWDSITAERACSDHDAPDGGPSCRNFRVLCVGQLPLSGSDRLNGIMERQIIHVGFSKYSQGGRDWTEWPNVWSWIERSKNGWTASAEDFPDESESSRCH